ncbi:MAG: hypothetical protein MUC65_01830 [Pontiellaceae bacterium]|nr:hypothetical protein [Pontiellaceae bacterium]
MKNRHTIRLLAFFLLQHTLCLCVQAQGTAITYQGRLTDGVSSASGSYDFRFTAYDAATAGSTVGSTATTNGVTLSNGVFTATLNFGAGVFTGPSRWLEIEVKTNGAPSYTTLTPRQPLTPSPYALYAPSAGTADTATTANEVATGSVGTAELAAGAVDSSRIADGAIAVGDLSPAVLSNTFWRLGGNASTTPETQFIGTIDNQPLEFKVVGKRVLRLQPGSASGTGTPSIVGGADNNSVYAEGSLIGSGIENIIQLGANSSSIAGGAQNEVHSNANYATIAGGRRNVIDTNAVSAAIGGGSGNTAIGSFATVPGGSANVAGSYSFAAGRRAKATHAGTFVWADSTNADFASTSSNQFLIRAAGGVGIGTNTPEYTLDVNGFIRTAGIVFPNGSVLSRASGTAPLITSGYTNGTTAGVTLNGSTCSLAEPLRFYRSVAVEIDVSHLIGYDYRLPTVKVRRARSAASDWASAFRNVLNGGVHASSNWFSLTITVSNLVPANYALTGVNGQLNEVLGLCGHQSLPLTVSRNGSTSASSPSTEVPDLAVQVNGVPLSGVVLPELTVSTHTYYETTGETNLLTNVTTVGQQHYLTLRANFSAGAALFNWFAAGDIRTVSVMRSGNTLFSSTEALPCTYAIFMGDDGLPIEQLEVPYHLVTVP